MIEMTTKRITSNVVLAGELEDAELVLVADGEFVDKPEQCI